MQAGGSAYPRPTAGLVARANSQAGLSAHSGGQAKSYPSVPSPGQPGSRFNPVVRERKQLPIDKDAGEGLITSQDVPGLGTGAGAGDGPAGARSAEIDEQDTVASASTKGFTQGFGGAMQGAQGTKGSQSAQGPAAEAVIRAGKSAPQLGSQNDLALKAETLLRAEIAQGRMSPELADLADSIDASKGHEVAQVDRTQQLGPYQDTSVVPAQTVYGHMATGMAHTMQRRAQGQGQAQSQAAPTKDRDAAIQQRLQRFPELREQGGSQHSDQAQGGFEHD